MGAESGRPALGFRRSESAPAENHGARFPRNGGNHAQTSRSTSRRSDDSRRRPRRRSHLGPRIIPLIATANSAAHGLTSFVSFLREILLALGKINAYIRN